MPRPFFYLFRSVENAILCTVTVIWWSEAAADIIQRWWLLCVIGIVCNAMLLPMVFLTTRSVYRNPSWVHPSARATADTSVKPGTPVPEACTGADAKHTATCAKHEV